MTPSACPTFLANPHLQRREFLRAGALSLFGLGLPTLLQGRGAANLPRRRAKACILLFMWGGPAQQDTWDPKPAAPVEYRGEFQPIATTVPGLQICEHMPRLAQRAHRLALVRSMTHNDVNHVTAPHMLLTGRPTPGGALADDFPSIGAVLSRLGRGSGPLPPFVSMMPVVPNGAPRFVEQTHGQGAGWLGPLHQPMRIDADASLPDYRVSDFALHADLTPLRTGGRQGLLDALDGQVQRLEGHPEMQAMTAHYQRAFSLLAAPQVARAFDLSQEPRALRERYGMNIHGQSVLQARRLVEAGVPMVTVFWPNDGITNVSVYWDTHNRNFIDLRERLCPVTDLAFSALLDDLEERGMLDETLVVWSSEFGRSPWSQNTTGRDHNPRGYTVWLAGGGVKGGVVHGATDDVGYRAVEQRHYYSDLHATILRQLGLDHKKMEFHALGRTMKLVEEGDGPITEILS